MPSNENATPTPPPQKTTANTYENFDLYHSNRLVALTNSTDAEIAPLLAAAGYSPTTITSKLSELATLKTLDDNQKKEYGEQYQATKDYDDLAATLHPIYLNHINWGRLIFENDLAAIGTLSLKGKRKRPESGYCNQALLFYEGALNNATYKAALVARGITEPMLQAGKTGFTNLKNMIPKKAKETGEAQQATAKRNAAWDTFDNWFIEFKKYGKLALSSKPQLREKLGWIEK